LRRGQTTAIGATKAAPCLRLREFSDERGAVYVEFLIAFIPLFILVLGICQLTFMASAKIVVEHSAWAAARAAVVVLEDDPQLYGLAPRGYYTKTSNVVIPEIADVLGAMSISAQRKEIANTQPVTVQLWGLSLKVGTSNPDLPTRMTKIRAAAYLPLLPLANTDKSANSSIRNGIHDNLFDRLADAVTYTRAAASVTLHLHPSDEALATEPIPSSVPITTRVVYLYSCDVPVVRVFMCRTWNAIQGNPSDVGVKALAQAEKYADLASRLPAGGRFALLTAKATLVNQGAGYEQ
jgi:Flp pilus assembly protein TadG